MAEKKSEITIEQIKKLKELSGVGLTDAKKALVEAKGDFDKALELYIKAAEMGNPAAQCYLGDIYYEGRNVEQNYQKAVDFYLAAEKQHQLNSNATKRLADCYQKGRGGLEADTKRAKTLLEKPSTNNISKLLELIK